MAPIIFLDTETTGLELDDDIWEFAAIRREDDGTETEHHWFVDHAASKCKQLPADFLEDHHNRFPAYHDGTYGDEVISGHRFTSKILELMSDRPHIVGAVPDFDMQRIGRMLWVQWSRKASAYPWHYHLIDVENLAVGYLARHGDALDVITPPWDSELLSKAVGVDPDNFERHTAMGDAKWARAIYDQVMGMKP